MQSTTVARSGRRDELIDVLRNAEGGIPGCELHLICRSPEDDRAVCAIESWVDEDAHRASLRLPEAGAAIEGAMPMMTSLEDSRREPVGGRVWG